MTGNLPPPSPGHDAARPTRMPRRPAVLRWSYRLLAEAGGFVLIAILAMGTALAVTPQQTVTVAGQVIEVGAAPALSLSGPAQVSLFGQTVPTAVSLPGPVRPRLQLSQITLNSELANFVEGSTPGSAAATLRSALIGGFEHYFAWEVVIAGLVALALAGAIAGWRRLPARTTIRLLAVALVVAEAVNLGGIALAGNGARHALAHVHSLNQLVASSPAVARRTATGRPVVHGVQEVVLGDSTAAGAGLPLVADPSAVDRACGRSTDAYAEVLARANGWKAVNLACDSATVSHGLLGPQDERGQIVPPQLSSASRISDPSVVIVSIGADDLQWSAILKVCAAEPSCDNRASAAFFQQKLHTFATAYLQLLIQLGSIPGHPTVIINRYYDPFGADASCVVRRGLTTAKVATLRTYLGALNKVLARGAAEFGFLSPQPNFGGHQICSKQPYVQGLAAPAPFHPTALGQLAIALADQAALARQAQAAARAAKSPSPSPSGPASPAVTSPAG